MRPNKALFLDRDGVINIEKNYVYRIEDFEFVDGIFDTLRFFQERGYLLIVITNQAGIGRGYYTENDFIQLTSWMVDRFLKQGVNINQVYYCPFHPEFGIGPYKRDSEDRKPKPGMLLKAKTDFILDMNSSVLIGDKESDIEAGINAGVGKTIKLLSDSQKAELSKADSNVNLLTEIPKLDFWS